MFLVLGGDAGGEGFAVIGGVLGGDLNDVLKQRLAENDDGGSRNWERFKPHQIVAFVRT